VASLEDRQQLHNRVITAIGNQSASNNFRQHANDSNDKLIASAEAFAAGRTLGMSEEETLAQMSKMVRRQRRQDDAFSMEDAERQMVQAANSLADVSQSAEIRGVGLVDLPEVDPFGQDQGQYYDYKEGDTQYGAQETAKLREQMEEFEDRSEPNQRNPYGKRTYDKRGQVVLKTGYDPNEYDRMVAELGEMGEGAERPTIAPKSVMQDALNQLNASAEEQQSLQGRIAQVFGGNDRQAGFEDAQTRLEDQLNPASERAIQADAARRMNERDLAGMSGRRAAYNNIMASIEAEDIGETMYRPSSVFPGAQLPAVAADEALDAIRRTGANITYPSALFRNDGVALDPQTGNTLAVQGPEYVTPNTDAGSALNAPMTSRAFMVQKQPGYREGGRSFGDYPQVDVTGTTTLFANRLKGQEGFNNISTNIRSVDELQRVTDMMVARGGKFSTKEMDPATGKLRSVRQSQPDVRGVLNRMRYTPAEEAQLANALYQMEVAKNAGINQQGKQQYFTRTGPMGSLQPTQFREFPDKTILTTEGGAKVFFDSPEAINPRDGQAPVARIQPGQQMEGKDIGSSFRRLTSPGARQPFIGAVEVIDKKTGKRGVEQDAGPGYKTRYNRTRQTDPVEIEKALREKERLNQVERAKKSGGRIMPVDEQDLRGKVVKAQLTQERANRDAKKRQEQERTVSQYTMANPNNVGRMPRRF
jgi:hypothetical protein